MTNVDLSGQPNLEPVPVVCDILCDSARLTKIRDLRLVDSPPESAFDRITRIATQMLDVPVALVSIVTNDRQFFKAARGLPEPWSSRRETPLSHSFCRHVVQRGEPLIVNDARTHEFIRDNLAITDLGVTAYLGFPIQLSGGERLGAFCCIDTVPREWSSEAIDLVRDLAELVNSELNLRNEIERLQEVEGDLERQATEVTSTKGFLRNILDSLDAQICIVNERGTIVDTNASWNYVQAEMRPQGDGFSVGNNYFEVAGQTVGSCAVAQQEVATALRDIISGRRTNYLGEHLCHAAATEVWFQVRITPLQSPDRRGAVISHMNVTDRVLATQQLELKTEEAEKLALVAQYTDNAVIITDDHARIEWINDAFTRQTGYELDEVIGRVPGHFLQGPDTSPQPVAEIREAIRARRGFDCELINYTKSGEPYWVALEGQPIADADGAVTRFVGIGRDITRRKNAEAERESLQRELVNASHLAGMAENATGVLHNVGNVLNSINVSVHLLRETVAASFASRLTATSELLQRNRDHLAEFVTEDKQGKLLPAFLEQLAARADAERVLMRDELEALLKNVEHVKEIVSAQQSYATTSTVQIEFNVCDVVDDALRATDRSFERHEIRVDRDYRSSPDVYTDKHKLFQIVVNLLSNAKDAVMTRPADDRHIRVVVSAVERSIEIEVHDNGIGISPENASKLFEHGFSTKPSGHGFGLHSSANSAHALGGELQVSSRGEGHGATFRLTFPRVNDKVIPAGTHL